MDLLAAAGSFVGQLVPACQGGLCVLCDLIKLADNTLRFLVAFSVMAAALMFAYAGFLYITAAGSKENLDKAKKVFSDVGIGLVVILIAWVGVDLILRVFTNQSINVLSNIQCVYPSGTSRTYDTRTGQKLSDSAVTGTQGGGTGDGTGGYCHDGDWTQYSGMLDSSINSSSLPDTVPTDIGTYCPKYGSMTRPQRTAFWNRYMSAIALPESGCKSNPTPYTEHTLGTDTVTGNTVQSEGIFQLSYGSESGRAKASGGKHCAFDYSKRDITDPAKNIDCGVYILDTDLKRFGNIDNAADYWAVEDTHRADLVAATKSVPGCY